MEAQPTANMPRLLAADAQRSDDPDLELTEAPVPAAASPSPIETAPTMQRVTGTFADPLHESAFAAQLFRMAIQPTSSSWLSSSLTTAGVRSTPYSKTSGTTLSHSRSVVL